MDRRTRYLETALRLFQRDGYHGVSMRQIVEATGGSKETIYRYFESKEALFSAIVEDLQARLAAAPTPDSGQDLPLAEGLRMLGRATASAALSETAIALLRLACGESARFPQLARLLYEQAPARSYERFKEFLRAKQEQGEVEIPDMQIAAEQFLSGLVGHQQLRMVLGVGKAAPEEIERRIHAAVEVFVKAYGVSVAPAT